MPSPEGKESARAMVVKRPTERVSAPAKAATGSKRPRAGTLSPVDPAFMPTAEGRAHGSSSTPLKAILDDYAEQQQQLTAASGSDDGMVGLHIGFDIPDAEPVGAAAVAQPVAPAAPVAPEIDQGDTTDLEQDGPAQADDRQMPERTQLSAKAALTCCTTAGASARAGGSSQPKNRKHAGVAGQSGSIYVA